MSLFYFLISVSPSGHVQVGSPHLLRFFPLQPLWVVFFFLFTHTPNTVRLVLVSCVGGIFFKGYTLIVFKYTLRNTIILKDNLPFFFVDLCVYVCLCACVCMRASGVRSVRSHICSTWRGRTTAYPMTPQISCCSPPPSGRGGEVTSHWWYTAGNTHCYAQTHTLLHQTLPAHTAPASAVHLVFVVSCSLQCWDWTDRRSDHNGDGTHSPGCGSACVPAGHRQNA